MKRVPGTAIMVALLCVGTVEVGNTQPCPEESYTLTTQVLVDEFPGSCTGVTGNVAIGPSTNITSLSALSALETVGGNLSIEDNQTLAEVVGLPNLVTVGGDLLIKKNESLAELSNLHALTSVGGNLEISNTKLTHLDALCNVTSVGQSLIVHFNENLAACSSGLYGLVTSKAYGGIAMHANAPSGDCNNDGADLTSVGLEDPDAMAESFHLWAAYPNPFNPSTVIMYSLPRASDVTLTVSDLLGREIRVLTSGYQVQGTHEVRFEASGLPTGVYLCRLEAGSYRDSRSLVLVR